MARIRTIKPEFFKHEELFDAEVEEGLPLRLAFAGLWTCCDREGRFDWRPRQLKTDVLPYDEVDFSRVLDALATRGFIVKYASSGKEYGFIPSWNRHQVINNRETASVLPEPVEIVGEYDASSTRGARDTVITKGKGREGKGKEGKGVGGASAPTEFAFVGKIVRLKVDAFDRWQKTYSAIPDFVSALTLADDYYSENPPNDGKWFFPVSRWLEKENSKAIKETRPERDPMYGVDSSEPTEEEKIRWRALGVS